VTSNVIAPVAEADIRDIADYIAADNIDAALRLVDDLSTTPLLVWRNSLIWVTVGRTSRIGQCASGR